MSASKTPLVDALQFMVGNETPLDDAFKNWYEIRELAHRLESDHAAMREALGAAAKFLERQAYGTKAATIRAVLAALKVRYANGTDSDQSESNPREEA